MLFDDEIFNKIFNDIIWTGNWEKQMKNKDGSLTVKFIIPGYSKNDTKITTKSYHNENIINIVCNNEEYGEKKMSYSLNKNYDGKSAEASVKDGVLIITFKPRKEENDGYLIDIK